MTFFSTAFLWWLLAGTSGSGFFSGIRDPRHDPPTDSPVFFHRIKVFTDLLQYSVPKLQAVSNSIEFEKMTDEQLDEVINQLMQAHEA